MMWSTSTRSVSVKYNPQWLHLPVCLCKSLATLVGVPICCPLRLLQYTQSPSYGDLSGLTNIFGISDDYWFIVGNVLPIPSKSVWEPLYNIPNHSIQCDVG